MINVNIKPEIKPEPRLKTSANRRANLGPSPAPSPVALSALQHNAADLEAEVAWCETVIGTRLSLYFQQSTPYETVLAIPMPCLQGSSSPYGHFIQQHQLGFADRLTLILALLPAIQPRVLDCLLIKNDATDQPYSEFGVVEWLGRCYASGTTLAFLIDGNALQTRLYVQSKLQASLSDRSALHCLEWQRSEGDALLMHTPLRLDVASLHLFTSAIPYEAEFGADFAAQRVHSSRRWEDLVLCPDLQAQLDDIRAWISHGEVLLQQWGLAGKIRPGYRALFFGPPGTGKTLTACLLGKSMGLPVYQIALSMVVSKYIGETEKNLEKIFALAENKNWILFFDEADALFGKRTQTTTANDQFANQNIAYLLQRIERFNGIAILASNYKDNFDEAFFRRFEAMLEFTLPGRLERLKIWQGALPDARVPSKLDLNAIADEHVLSAAAIMNVVRFASMRAVAAGREQVRVADIDEGIRRETGDAKKDFGRF